MKSLSRARWPKWIKERLEGRKNVEVKEKAGRYYLYEYQNVWDKEKKRSKKKTYYMGTLRMESGNAPMVDHGNVFLLYKTIEDKIPFLKKAFPDSWKHLVAFSMYRLINPLSIKRVPSWFERTSLSKLLAMDKTSSKTIRRALEEIGSKPDAQKKFMKDCITGDDYLLYDGSVVFSISKYSRLLETGQYRNFSFLPRSNVALLFSKKDNMPVYFKAFFGSIHEADTIPEIAGDIGEKNIFFIADRVYHKTNIYDKLHQNKIRFGMALPRDDPRIEYNRSLSGIMKYNERMMKYAKYSVKGNDDYYIYHYEDQLLKYEETTEYLKFKKAGRIASFKKKWAGKIAILSNAKMDPEEIYLYWKKRHEVEKAFRVLQIALEMDTSNITNKETFAGYLFASFISLYMHYTVMNIIKRNGLWDKITVEDVLFEMSKVMLTGDDFKPLEIPKSTMKMINSLGLGEMMRRNPKKFQV